MGKAKGDDVVQPREFGRTRGGRVTRKMAATAAADRGRRQARRGNERRAATTQPTAMDVGEEGGDDDGAMRGASGAAVRGTSRGRGRGNQVRGPRRAARTPPLEEEGVVTPPPTERGHPNRRVTAGGDEMVIWKPTSSGLNMTERENLRVEIANPPGANIITGSEDDSNSRQREMDDDVVQVDDEIGTESRIGPASSGSSDNEIEVWRTTQEWKILTGRREFLRRNVYEVIEELQLLEKNPKTDLSRGVKLATLAEYGEEMKSLRAETLEYLILQNLPTLYVDLELRVFGQTRESILRVNGEAKRREEGGRIEANGGVTVRTHRTAQLPDMQPTKFTGETSKWAIWWPQYAVIHDDPGLTELQKFRFLHQCIQPGTDVARLLDRYPMTPANYHHVIKELRELYGNPEVIINELVSELSEVATKGTKGPSDLRRLFEDLDSKIQALISMGWDPKSSSGILYPVIRAALPTSVALEWEKVREKLPEDMDHCGKSTNLLERLMEFLRQEVRREQLVAMSSSSTTALKRDFQEVSQRTSTAAGLMTTSERKPSNNDAKKPRLDKGKCIFDQGAHSSLDCWKAPKMPIVERMKCARVANVCYRCLTPGHRADKCKKKVVCLSCGGPHVTVLCRGQNPNGGAREPRREREVQLASPGKPKEKPRIVTQCLNVGSRRSKEAPLQTVKVWLCGPYGKKLCRAVLDTGAMKSAILKKTAKNLKMTTQKKVKVKHQLYGGGETQFVDHDLMSFEVKSVDGGFGIKLTAFSEEKIVGQIINDVSNEVLEELRSRNIKLADPEGDEEIELLLGNDVYGRILTGDVRHLDSGVTVIGTKFGDVISGPCEEIPVKKIITPFLINLLSVEQLCDLNLLGIRDPIESKKKKEADEETKEHFRSTVSRKIDGRYQVKLPVVMDLNLLPDNYVASLKILESMAGKLRREEDYYKKYDNVLAEWEKEGVVEKVPVEDINKAGCHYLPHRMVLKKDSATTQVRPVFNASFKRKEDVSLNNILAKGPNMLELIPDLLLRFRNGKFAAIADLKKAFLQIEVAAEDRDLLRFLWYDVDKETVIVYRHKRVVFGVNASPFLLAAVLEAHLKSITGVDAEIATVLLRSFDVDNVVASFEEEEEYRRFKEVSVKLMSKAKFELRLWESNVSGEIGGDEWAKILGLEWNKKRDTLRIAELKVDLPSKVTKRIMLATSNAVYDPLGMMAPVTLLPKMMLRESHKMKLGWDDAVTKTLSRRFLKWYRQLRALEKMELRRSYTDEKRNVGGRQLHIFSDASKEAFAAVAFLRTEDSQGHVEVSFVQSRTRLAPEEASIPRKELLGCTIAARLAKAINEAVGEEWETTFWTDSMTALEWIRKTGNWGVFVNNRTKEIRELTNIRDWRFVPGILNPADLPSRGVDAEKFVELKWWEGPEFLRENPATWPAETEKTSRELVEVELKKTTLLSTVTGTWIPEFKFVGYRRNLRAFAFLLKAVKLFKAKGKKLVKQPEMRAMAKATRASLESCEIEEAEKTLWKLLQAGMKKSDGSVGDLKLVEKDGLLRVTTKLIHREDDENFIWPVLLPNHHNVVKALIWDIHVENNHAGAGTVTTKLRERVWIRRARKTTQGILKRCTLCMLRGKKKMSASEIALPRDRVKDAKVFQVTGIDYGGPLYIFDVDARGEPKKVWFAIFTCAVFRAIHLELVSSLSTENFTQALRRFISRRGRPATIYTDNGTNFKGLENQLGKIDWDEVRNSSVGDRIEWKFNPPTAAWWGGFWERMVGVVKGQLVKVLGRAQLNWEELMTTLCDIEAVVNSRPLTYVGEDPRDLAPLTPNMFLMDQPANGVGDLDRVDGRSYQRRLEYRQKLKEDLRQRFRNEYLGQLAALRSSRDGGSVKVGDVVLMEVDNVKRVNWPLGRVLELFTGKDGEVRLVKLKTTTGEKMRPVQRLVKLELEQLPEGAEMATKSGIQPDQGRAAERPHTGVSRVSKDNVGAEVEWNSYLQEWADLRKTSTKQVDESSKQEDVAKKIVKTKSGRISRAPDRLIYNLSGILCDDNLCGTQA